MPPDRMPPLTNEPRREIETRMTRKIKITIKIEIKN
jgi:hypothetical protein